MQPAISPWFRTARLVNGIRKKYSAAYTARAAVRSAVERPLIPKSAGKRRP